MPRIVNTNHVSVDYFLGIDPGKSGAATLLDKSGKPFLIDGKISCVFGKLSEQEIACWFDSINQLQAQGCIVKAAIELVHSSPQMGVVSAFTFGKVYGILKGLLAAYSISYTDVRPQVWQKFHKCLSKGNKNVTKFRAHQLWPAYSKSITHGNADSILIADYVRQTCR